VDADKDTLAIIFRSRVMLAKKTEDEAAEEAREEHRRTIKWIASSAVRKGSFLWLCDEFDLEPSAVRRGIQEKKA
jgi:hypothetical protein